MFKAIFRSSICLAAVAASSTAAAAETAHAVAADADSIIVTATRAPLTLGEIPSSVAVLDKEAIDRAQDIGVTELLLRTPGISMSRNGGYGTSTSLRIRGAESEHTVTVIDGVKLNDPSSTGGGFNFANLLVGDIDRIEVLRGPQSILWGSQAIGGVINIVTASPEQPIEGSFDLEAGSRATVSARAAIGGRTGPLSWRLGGQRFATDGISSHAKAFGGVERDGYRNSNVSGRAELALADNVSAEVRGTYSSGRVEFDGFNTDSSDYGQNKEFVGYAGLNFDLADGRFRNRIAYAYTDTNRDNFNPDRARPQSFEADGKNKRWEYQGSFDVSDRITAIFGVENERSSFRSRSPSASLGVPLPDFVRGTAEITSAYGQLSVEPVDGLTLNGGIRYDDHSRYGGQTLFAAGGVWRLPTGTVLRASYGEGFKAPGLYQLFSEYGNVGLDPEEAHGWEAGVEQHLLDSKLVVGATWFDRTTKNQIIYNGCSSPTTDPLCTVPGSNPPVPRFGYYLNVARSEAHGVEAAAALTLGGLTLDGNYSWIVAEDGSPGDNFGNWLPRRPRHSANASASYAFGFGLELGAALRWSGKSYDNASNAQRLDDYMLVDLRAEVALSGAVKLFARAENIFDEDYMTAYRYGSLGRSIYAGIRGRF
jgi:vitamin B12 transporter